MLPDWPRALGVPQATGRLRSSREDFEVEELFELEFSNDGEFDWLWVEKSGDNTDYVARRLAEMAGVSLRAVTYSGLKDRHAVTRQWFCVHLPGKTGRNWDDSAEQSADSRWQVLRWGRHRQKLRPGSHRGNRFVLTLREVVGDREELENRLEQLSAGFPNYFGEQRFGIGGDNLTACRQWFAGELRPQRFQRGIYLSSARSYLFNEVLAARLRAGNWVTALSGELFSLRDSGSVFAADADSVIARRLLEGDIHPSGPLYGSAGRHSVSADVAALEEAVFSANEDFCAGLRRHAMKMERRSLRVIPQQLRWQWLAEDTLQLQFSLPRGCFATALVREFINA